ncbi:MAG: lipase family protein [Bacteroidota bacterium]|nr:lipase family protein [Bacteroidota bacterium]
MLAKINLPCQLLNACACTYDIVDNTKTYNPESLYADTIGWGLGPGAPTVITGQNEKYYDAALVGIVQNLHVNNTVAPGIVIAFQGTISVTTPGGLKDWMTDFDATPVPFIEGKTGDLVHKGIYDSVKSILSQILQALSTLQNANNSLPIFVTGHSKGGGMAPIAAAILINKYKYVIQEVYTFAAPMIGNASFGANFPLNKPVQRFENYIDIIPFLMPNDTFISTLRTAANNATPIHKVEMDLFIDFLLTVRNKFSATGYVPLGNLNFINENRTITVTSFPPNTPNPSAIDLASKLASGLPGFVIVGNAHSHACGSKVTTNGINYFMGYMGGVANHMGLCK